MRSVSIIGIGRIGGALALALAQKQYRVENLIYRNPDTAKLIASRISPSPGLFSAKNLPAIYSDVVFITSGDPEIQSISKELVSVIKSNAFVFHTSGSLSSEILSNFKDIGCKTGSIHPLVSISEPIPGAENFSGAYFSVEGDTEAVEAASEIVRTLGGIPFTIPATFKALYHASAVTACGHLVALIDVAIEMLSKCGLEADEAKSILLPLIQSTVENLKLQNTEDALTGSFVRADAEAFDRHLEALQAAVSIEAREIYLNLGERSMLLAERRGVRAESIQKMRDRISIAKRNLR